MKLPVAELLAAPMELAGLLPLRIVHVPDLVRIAAAVEPVVHPHGRFLQCFNGLRLQQHAAALLPGKFQEALLIYFPIAECEVDIFPERVMQVHMMEPFPACEDKGLIDIAVEIVMPDVERQAESRTFKQRVSRRREEGQGEAVAPVGVFDADHHSAVTYRLGNFITELAHFAEVEVLILGIDIRAPLRERHIHAALQVHVQHRDTGLFRKLHGF